MGRGERTGLRPAVTAIAARERRCEREVGAERYAAFRSVLANLGSAPEEPVAGRH